MLILAAVLAVIAGVVWFAARVRRNGDFSFRIHKLKERTGALVSELMKLRDEADYLSLYKDRLNQEELDRFGVTMDQANQIAVEVNDQLSALGARARSWLNFSDLYVDIGAQEERLEEAEKLGREARTLFERLEREEKSLPK